jgi:MSHA biogenesis protein MshJ
MKQDAMKQRIAAWAERYEAFSLRERALVMLAVIVLMFMLWDAMLMSPEELRQKQVVAKMQSMNQQTEALNMQIREMSAALRGGEAQHIEARVSELQSLLKGLEQQQKDLTVQFIQPVQMAGVLREMLSAENGLVLTQLTSLGAQPLFPRTDDDEENIQAASQKNQNLQKQNDINTSASHRPEVYKHGMRIVFEGDYFKTLSYLRALEAMPWRLYWDNVEYHVTDYPKARVAITVHTLSLQEGWIGV